VNKDGNTTSWRKSSHSSSQGGDCVESAAMRGGVGVRDSKNPGLGPLLVDAATWSALIATVNAR